MAEWLVLFCLTLATGLAMAVGALIASVEHISIRWLESEFRHSVIAFGGGILFAAVALVLVPEGMLSLSTFSTSLWFALGGICFMLFDILLNSLQKQAPQLAAMLLDFIPEVIALGAIYLLHKKYAYLLALLIILQNIPEGFNAYRELYVKSSHKGWVIITSFLVMSLIGPLAGLSGYFFLTDYPEVIAAIMLFGAGGILYLIFQDIAPQVKLRYHWAPSLGAVIGFLFGMIGKMLIVQ